MSIPDRFPHRGKGIKEGRKRWDEKQREAKKESEAEAQGRGRREAELLRSQRSDDLQRSAADPDIGAGRDSPEINHSHHSGNRVVASLTTFLRKENAMEKATMSVQELSSYMGISLPKAYALVKQPDFPNLRIGTRILIPVEGFKEWLKNSSSQQ